MASIPAGKTVILILHGLDGGSSDLSVWQELADCLKVKILLAIVEFFKRLSQDLVTNTTLGQVNSLLGDKAVQTTQNYNFIPPRHSDGLDQIPIEKSKYQNQGVTAIAEFITKGL
jgi:hypothetical protein